jgi:hypothetical protein
LADPETYVIQLAGWLGEAIGDSAGLFADFTTETVGLELPPAVVQAPAVAAALQQAATVAGKVGTAGTDVTTAAGGGDDDAVLSALLELGVALIAFFAALADLAAKVRANVTPATVPDPTARAATEHFADDLAKILSNAILGAGITDQAPQIAFILRLLGLMDWRRVPKDAANPASRDYVLRALALQRIKTLFTDPATHYRDALGWGAPAFDPSDIFSLYEGFWDDEMDIETGVAAGDPFLRQGMFRISRDSSVAPPALSVSLLASLTEDFERRTPIDDRWGLGVKAEMRMDGSVSGRISPPLSFTLLPAALAITGKLTGFVDRNPEARPFDIVGGTGLLTMSATNISAGVGLEAGASTAAGVNFNPLIFVNVEALTLLLGSDDADSFIGSLLSSAKITGSFDLGLEWQADTGLRVKASGGIEVALPIHKQLGPIDLETLYVALRIKPDATLSLELSAALSGVLGPLTAAVDRIGITLDAKFVEGTDAKFGPFDLNLGFKPPNGIGLAIDAGVVKGGGYIYLDFDKGEYAGLLELTVSDWLSLHAIGLINTKLPGGQPGFSLLVIITAEFSPGLQLGYGFTLIGVGGLLGLNRAMLIDPMVQGVRTGAINSILFPTNIIANASKILSDLRAIFPPQEGIFLIGPMAKIGWGTPTLISVALGVIIEIPGDVVILGRLRLALPTDDQAILVLQVSFLGVLEFSKRRIWFFATLFESRILFMTLEGEMGLLMDFSDSPDFVLSVGGFHPRFKPPPLPFPSPARLAITLVDESFAKVRVETYFAVTTNSVQLGARAEAFFGFDAFSVNGYFSFDALLRFSPVYLIVEISAGFSVKVFGVGVWGVHLRGSLEGPTPWHVHGSAEIDILFFSFDVDVDVTFGEARHDTLPPIEVLPAILAEFQKLESWRATLPSSGRLCVSLRSLDSATVLALHPVGTLQISQRFAPLNLPLDKIGNQRPSDVNKVSVSVQSGALTVRGPVRELFAAAQYRDMDDAAKLSAPAFEPMDSGVELGAAGSPWATGRLAQRNVRYETVIIDTALEPARDNFVVFPVGLFEHFRRGATITRLADSAANERFREPFADKVTLPGEAYTVAFQSDNRAFAGGSTFGSFAEAQAHFEATVANDPSLADTIHVIPGAEVNLAA